jgi:two-component system cell cycle sensor histidine kinase/response regulator CckA
MPELYLPWALLAAVVAGGGLALRRYRRALLSADLRVLRIRQAVESAGEAIGIGDFEGNSWYHNAAHVALFDYTVAELNAVPGAGVLFADPAVAQAILGAVRAGRSWSGETDILTKDGQRIPAYVRADIIRDDHGKPVGIFGVFRDITRERQLAEEAARAQQLDSLGMMAGGIAHDFNNLLTAMLIRIDLAKLQPGVGAQTAADLEEIAQVGRRAQELTRRLKAFAKGEAPEKRLLQLPALIREAVNLAAERGSRVTLRWDLAEELPPVMADESQLLQVLNNLALNAVQAMAGGGSLTVAARAIPPADAPAAHLEERDWVRVSLTDTGIGIPPENLKRIFEPFFTTKATGTGLGLATCFSIVAKHGGHLRVESAPGRGTTFHVLLPASPALPAAGIAPMLESRGRAASLPPLPLRAGAGARP